MAYVDFTQCRKTLPFFFNTDECVRINLYESEGKRCENYRGEYKSCV